MEGSSQFLLTLGGILLLGLLTSALARRTFLPRVTLLLLLGALIGGEALDVIPRVFAERFELIADMTLLMVGFLLGGKLTRKALHNATGEVVWISLSAALFTTILVTLGLIGAGASIEIAIILGCLASATDPAAVVDVVTEAQVRNRFSRVLLSIVALDDVWALLLFGFGMALVGTMNGHDTNHAPLLQAMWEIGGAVALGLALGLPAAFLTGRLKKGQPMLSEALGIVFVCGGLAIWLGVSYLIAAIVMGAVIANLARHHEYPFHAIEGIEWPFMVVFFVLAGASLEFGALRYIGLIGGVYVVSRVLGKYLGALIGARISATSPPTRNWMGAALLPQAGVAMGMALVASNEFPQYRQVLLPVVIVTTVLFEVIGPVFTRLAIRRAETP